MQPPLGLVVGAGAGAGTDVDVAGAGPGIHPPSTQWPPPMEVNGSGPTQLLVVEAGIEEGTAVGAGVGVAKEVVVVAGAGPGIHPPFTQ